MPEEEGDWEELESPTTAQILELVGGDMLPARRSRRGGRRPGAGRPKGSRGEGRPSKAEQRKSPDHVLEQALRHELERLGLDPDLAEEIEIRSAIEQELLEIQGVGINERLIRQMALEGLACIRHHVRRGNVKCAMFVVNRLMGSPEKPYSDQAREMSPEELHSGLRSLLQAKGLPEPIIDLVMIRLQEPDASTEAQPVDEEFLPVVTDAGGAPDDGAAVEDGGGELLPHLVGDDADPGPEELPYGDDDEDDEGEAL